MSYDGVESERISHLQMIQDVIGRLGNDSFLLKGWAVTIAGALLGFAVSQESWRLAIVAIITTLLFWLQDALFLKSERLFRVLYEEVRKPNSEIEPFFMNATAKDFVEAYDGKNVGDWSRAFFRPTLLGFYLVLIVAAGLIAKLVS